MPSLSFLQKTLMKRYPSFYSTLIWKKIPCPHAVSEWVSVHKDKGNIVISNQQNFHQSIRLNSLHSSILFKSSLLWSHQLDLLFLSVLVESICHVNHAWMDACMHACMQTHSNDRGAQTTPFGQMISVSDTTVQIYPQDVSKYKYIKVTHYLRETTFPHNFPSLLMGVKCIQNLFPQYR